MKKSFIDRIVAAVSPSRALQRLHSKARLEVATALHEQIVKQQTRKYAGASRGRHYSGWFSPNLSVNQEVMQALSILRDRSRDLARNNPYAVNAVRVLRNNAVGVGIIPTPKMRKGSAKNQAKAIKDAWASWADNTACDYDDMNTFYGIQGLVMKVVLEAGECLIRRVPGTSKDVLPLRLQVLEGDFINTAEHTGVWGEDGTITYYGIKFGKDGRRIGYYLFKHHPSEFGTESEFVKAEDIIHVFEVERPGQIRGVPFSSPIMGRLRDLDDYEGTERMRAKVAACFAVFVRDGGTSENATIPKGSELADLEKVEPGMIKYLQPGQEIQTAQPPVATGYGDFTKGSLRGISAGFGVSYEAVTNDYSNVNFSSGRMGWLELNRNVEHLQWNMLIPRFCDKVYAWFVDACQLKGVVPFGAQVSVSWTPPRREMIDPAKEIQALKEQVRAGFCSWQDVVRMFGYIPEDLQEEIKQDKEMWDKLGLMPTVDPRFDTNRPPEETTDSPPDKEDTSSESPD